MNPLTKVKLINELNEREAELGIRESVSWHTEYRGSAWIFVGGFPYELTEGDLICVFSQYGEVVNINLVRDKKTGKSKGFCFICYEDQRSTVLAVDNFNGIKIKGRTIRVDHVKDYRPPKDSEDMDDVTKRLREDGCAPTAPPAASSSPEDDEQEVLPLKKPKKDKKEKKKKKKEKKKKRSRTSSSSPPPAAVRVKEEKQDTAYDKYNHKVASPGRQRTMDTERGRWEEEERKRGTDGDEDKWRNREREGRKREMNRDERWKGTDRADRRRDDYRRQEMDRDDRRREKDRDDDRRWQEMKDRQKMERDEDRRRETDRR